MFRPLGITVERILLFHNAKEQQAFNKATDISGWVIDSAGVNAAGWGLTLSPADMDRIGQLYLNGGTWNGKRIVPEHWVRESTKEHSRWKNRNLPYGYLWWVHADGYAAMGDGGNVTYVNTKKNMVVSISSLFKRKARDRIELIQSYIEPMFEV